MGLIKDLNYVRDVCKIGEGHQCCRYLTTGAEGWNCIKHYPDPIRSLLDVMEGKAATKTVKQLLDERVARGEMTARGDNCEGR